VGSGGMALHRPKKVGRGGGGGVGGGGVGGKQTHPILDLGMHRSSGSSRASGLKGTHKKKDEQKNIGGG